MALQQGALPALPKTLPTGVVAVILAYVGIVLILRFAAPACMEEPCQSEGVDDSVIAWASDFVVGVAAFAFGMHLICAKDDTRKSGILAQIFLSGCFALMGIMRWMFPNNGQGDNLGMAEYWIVWGIASFFLTLSAGCHAYFAIECTFILPRGQEPKCTIRCVQLFLAGLTASCLANMAGCGWCALTPLLHTTDAHDNYIGDLDFKDQHMCIQIVDISEFLIWYSYALLWIPMGMLLRAAAMAKHEHILGLPTPWAAVLALVAQWTTGSMYFVVIGFVAWFRRELGSTNESFLHFWAQVYGVEIFHVGMLLTAYCAHNLTWSLVLLPTIQRAVSRQSSSNGLSSCVRSEGKQVRFGGETSVVSIVNNLDCVEEGTISSGSMPESGSSSICSSSVGSASAARYNMEPPSPRRRPAAVKSLLKVPKAPSFEEKGSSVVS